MKMKNPYVISLLALVLLFSCKHEEQTVTPEVRTIISAVYASGSVEPRNQYQVFAPAGGILNQKLVDAGDSVQQGQPLFVISQETSDLQLQNAEQRLRTARRNASENSPILRDLRLQIEAKKEQYSNDSVTYARHQNLINNKATSQAALDQARLQFLSSRSIYQAAITNYEQQKDDLQAQLSEAQINYQLAAEEKGNTVVKSRLNGKVYQTYMREGEMVTLNQPLAEVGDEDAFILELLVDERDIAKLEPGMTVLFTSDILPDTTLEAKVSKIYPYMNDENRSFRVDAELNPMGFKLFDGASVEANIIVSQKENALVIPRTALIGEDSVMIEEDGEARKVKITKGIENMEMVEVLSGLSENTKLITQR